MSSDVTEADFETVQITLPRSDTFIHVTHTAKDLSGKRIIDIRSVDDLMEELPSMNEPTIEALPCDPDIYDQWARSTQPTRSNTKFSKWTILQSINAMLYPSSDSASLKPARRHSITSTNSGSGSCRSLESILEEYDRLYPQEAKTKANTKAKTKEKSKMEAPATPSKHEIPRITVECGDDSVSVVSNSSCYSKEINDTNCETFLNTKNKSSKKASSSKHDGKQDMDSLSIWRNKKEKKDRGLSIPKIFCKPFGSLSALPEVKCNSCSQIPSSQTNTLAPNDCFDFRKTGATHGDESRDRSLKKLVHSNIEVPGPRLLETLDHKAFPKRQGKRKGQKRNDVDLFVKDEIKFTKDFLCVNDNWSNNSKKEEMWQGLVSSPSFDTESLDSRPSSRKGKNKNKKNIKSNKSNSKGKKLLSNDGSLEIIATENPDRGNRLSPELEINDRLSCRSIASSYSALPDRLCDLHELKKPKSMTFLAITSENNDGSLDIIDDQHCNRGRRRRASSARTSDNQTTTTDNRARSDSRNRLASTPGEVTSSEIDRGKRSRLSKSKHSKNRLPSIQFMDFKELKAIFKSSGEG